VMKINEDKKFTVKELPLTIARGKVIVERCSSLSDAELVAILLRTGKKGKSVLEIGPGTHQTARKLSNACN